MAQQTLDDARMDHVEDVHKKKGRQELTCGWCYNYHGVRVLRHMLEACKHCPVPAGSRKAAAFSKINELQESARVCTKNMFFNPKEIDDRMYSKAEVCHLLERWGHEAVSKQLMDTVNITPQKMPHVTYMYQRQAVAASLLSAMNAIQAPLPPAMPEMSDDRT